MLWCKSLNFGNKTFDLLRRSFKFGTLGFIVYSCFISLKSQATTFTKKERKGLELHLIGYIQQFGSANLSQKVELIKCLNWCKTIESHRFSYGCNWSFNLDKTSRSNESKSCIDTLQPLSTNNLNHKFSTPTTFLHLTTLWNGGMSCKSTKQQQKKNCFFPLKKYWFLIHEVHKQYHA